MMKALLAATLGLVLMMPSSISAQTLRALPVDEGASNQSFSSFRSDLLQAIERRDADYVVSQASSEIELSFGGASGHEDFRKLLTVGPNNLAEDYRHLAPQMRAEYWANLETTLRLGGRFQEGGDVFVAPYTWSVDLPEYADPFETYFVTGDGVALRGGPSKSGEVISRLSYDIVTMMDLGEVSAPYLKIRLNDDTTGFAHSDYLRSSVGYRAFFTSENGQWKMTTFIAGD
ncbi:SH3 domain-containing protein [Falsihalocynthiibacter sp. S25ZX9]|uniref:SH3 domain-containing protein n=1 Tax=Falsihalocynthiibacter sp. S25ZX9 TaxID=3240870 RepID=UPI00350ECB51